MTLCLPYVVSRTTDTDIFYMIISVIIIGRANHKLFFSFENYIQCRRHSLTLMKNSDGPSWWISRFTKSNGKLLPKYSAMPS